MKQVRFGLLVVVLALTITACGVGVNVSDQKGDGATSGQISEADLEATVQARLDKERGSASGAPEASQAAAAISAADIEATVQARLEKERAAQASAQGATASSVASPAASATTEARGAATEAVPTSQASSAATETVPTTQASAQPIVQRDALPPMLLILDSSGSMLLDDGTGQPKIAAAKSALNSLVDALPDGAQVGLRVYGHRYPNTDKANGCQDTQLIAPIDPLNKSDMKNKINSFEAKGYTPISLSLEEGFKDLPAEGKRVMVLVSDGEETCDRDPCQVAAGLKAQGVDLVVEPVGFQVDDKTRAQLQCIADKTGGTYRDAKNAQELADQLKQITTRAAQDFQSTGQVVQPGTSFSTAPVVPFGTYQTTIVAGETLYYAVELKQGQGLRSGVTIAGDPSIKCVSDLFCGGEVTLKVYDPSRQDLFLPGTFKNEWGNKNISVGGDVQPVGAGPLGARINQPGKYYVELSLVDTKGLLGNREFPVEFLFEEIK